jgi:uncharacterized membrane protein
MRPSTRTIITLNLFVGFAIFSLAAWMPEAKMSRVPLWLLIAAFTGILLDRRFDKRL